MKHIWILFFLLLFCACSKTVAAPPPQQTPSPTASPTPTPSPTAATVFVSVTMGPATPVPTTPAPTDTPEPPVETATPVPTPAPLSVREDLSAQCVFQCTQQGVERYAFIDNDLHSNFILADGTRLTYSWGADVPADVLYLFSYTLPDSFRLVQTDEQGAVLKEEEVTPPRMCSLFPLEEGCRSISITSQGRCKLNALQILGPGDILPEKVVWWDEPKEYCELLLVSTHFDDEILMMGAVFPTYAGDQHRDCAIIYAVNEDDRVRQMEAMQGLWEMGVRREPVVLSFTFASMRKSLEDDAAGVFQKNDLAVMVGLLRQLRPLVVVTHDVEGEYGHQEHKKVSALVRRAVELAADPAYDPDSVKEYGVWQVQKEYIHLWKENPLVLDVNTPLENMKGRTALQVARAAFAYHKTQQKWSVDVQNHKNPIGQFGLYYTAVGPDSGINDMMENVIPPTLPLS